MKVKKYFKSFISLCASVPLCDIISNTLCTPVPLCEISL